MRIYDRQADRRRGRGVVGIDCDLDVDTQFPGTGTRNEAYLLDLKFSELVRVFNTVLSSPQIIPQVRDRQRHAREHIL